MTLSLIAAGALVLAFSDPLESRLWIVALAIGVLFMAVAIVLNCLGAAPYINAVPG